MPEHEHTLIAGFTFFQLMLMYGFALLVVIAGLAIERRQHKRAAQNDRGASNAS